ncbi:MAG: hypothetical protein P8N02_01440 [Actinomycetota bacterium]|nr:hypothetical protein [Actinomycetota bacterium]
MAAALPNAQVVELDADFHNSYLAEDHELLAVELGDSGPTPRLSLEARPRCTDRPPHRETRTSR